MLFRNISNKVGPKIDPFGTPESNNSKVLQILLMFTFYFLSFK